MQGSNEFRGMSDRVIENAPPSPPSAPVRAFPERNLAEQDYLVNIAKSANVDYRPSSKPSDKLAPLTPSSNLAEKPASLSSEAIAKRYLSSARPVAAGPKHMSSKRLGDLSQEFEDSRRSRQNVTPVVIAHYTL